MKAPDTGTTSVADASIAAVGVDGEAVELDFSTLLEDTDSATSAAAWPQWPHGSAQEIFRQSEIEQGNADVPHGQWMAQSDTSQAQTLDDTTVPLTAAQLQALNMGAGPLTPQAAQEWVAYTEQAIGPAANGRHLPPSKAYLEATAAWRASASQAARDFWNGTGPFAPTVNGNGSLLSALTDVGRAAWNMGVEAASLVDMIDPLASPRRSVYESFGIDIPQFSGLRATYDTPAFGLTLEMLSPFVPLSRLHGTPRTLGGAAFVDGMFVHDLKPLSNLELYGQAVTRTPEEALQLLQRVGHDSDVLSQYQIVKLTDHQYSRMSGDIGFHFDATYGSVPPRAASVTFNGNIASKMADGTSKIPIYVRKEVFDSDEALVQILSHEIYETQELKFLASRPISTTEYLNLVKANGPGNLHHQAVQEGDWWLQQFRNLAKN
jgi:hypothetical protein